MQDKIKTEKPHYESLSEELCERIENDRKNGTSPKFYFDDRNVVRRDENRHDGATVLRPPFIRDTDKILNCPYYNRYADKTQVFSFYRNDDISRRGLHVQLVSRIARTIGKALNLNLELIEAISLGHDIGHTPFGHAGETILDELYFGHAGKHFSHNIHSVRVLDGIFCYNISLQTLSGIASHDGELEMSEYHPKEISTFSRFDSEIEKCYSDRAYVKKLVPSTLEGCVMRISDIIAYLGKDRQDAERAHIINQSDFSESRIGRINAEFINNLMVNIVENSYNKPYIKMDETHFDALQKAKAENYEKIYNDASVRKLFDKNIKPIMSKLYDKLLYDIKNSISSSPIFTHHIDYVNQSHYVREFPYEEAEPDTLVVDYIASMTDDYCIELYKYLFPKSNIGIEYKGYFED